jgi:hypothetical protein
MKFVARIGDIGKGVCQEGHDDVPEGSDKPMITKMNTGSPDVRTNNKFTVRIGDIGKTDCGHITKALTGEPTVRVNNKWIHHTGDTGKPTGGGEYKELTGSPNVRVNGNVPAVTFDDENPIYANTSAGNAAQQQDEKNFDPALPTDHEDNKEVTDVETPPLGSGLVLLFRGLNPTKTSAAVDTLAGQIGQIPGYTARVFDYQNEAGAKALIQPTGNLIMIGYSAGCQPVRNISRTISRKVDLMVMIDGISSIALQFLPALPANVTKAYNYYNPPNYGNAGPNAYGGQKPVSGGKVVQKLLPVSHSAIVAAASPEILGFLKALPSTSAPPYTTNPALSPATNLTTAVSFEGEFSERINWPVDQKKQISKYFRLSTIRRKPIDTPERKLRDWQIANNWVRLCRNVLDPIYDRYKFTFNSGFRDIPYNRSIGSTDGSDHVTGAACDISMGSQAANIELFKYIVKSGLPFSQLIFEGNWVHVAHGGAGPMGVARIMWTFNGRAPFGKAGTNLAALPPTLRV